MRTHRKSLAGAVVGLAWLGAEVAPQTGCAGEPEPAAKTVNYGRPFEPPARPAVVEEEAVRLDGRGIPAGSESSNSSAISPK